MPVCMSLDGGVASLQKTARVTRRSSCPPSFDAIIMKLINFNEFYSFHCAFLFVRPCKKKNSETIKL